MPKTQKKGRIIFSWIGKYKALFIICLLIIICASYVAASAISRHLQLHAEGQSYKEAAILIEGISKSLPGSPREETYQRCSYTDNGAVFATRFLGCSTGVNASYADLSPESAQSQLAAEKKMLSKKGLTLRQNAGGYSANDIGIFTFTYRKLSCGLSATYYDSTVPSSKRYHEATPEGDTLFMVVSCSGSAKTPYFPVVQD